MPELADQHRRHRRKENADPNAGTRKHHSGRHRSSRPHEETELQTKDIGTSHADRTHNLPLRQRTGGLCGTPTGTLDSETHTQPPAEHTKRSRRPHKNGDRDRRAPTSKDQKKKRPEQRSGLRGLFGMGQRPAKPPIRDRARRTESKTKITTTEGETMPVAKSARRRRRSKLEPPPEVNDGRRSRPDEYWDAYHRADQTQNVITETAIQSHHDCETERHSRNFDPDSFWDDRSSPSHEYDGMFKEALFHEWLLWHFPARAVPGSLLATLRATVNGEEPPDPVIVDQGDDGGKSCPARGDAFDDAGDQSRMISEVSAQQRLMYATKLKQHHLSRFSRRQGHAPEYRWGNNDTDESETASNGSPPSSADEVGSGISDTPKIAFIEITNTRWGEESVDSLHSGSDHGSDSHYGSDAERSQNRMEFYQEMLEETKKSFALVDSWDLQPDGPEGTGA